jgi:hypothetical protein
MKNLGFLAILLVLGFGQLSFGQEQARLRSTNPLPEHFRLNSVPANEMQAASEYIDNELTKLYKGGSRTWHNFRNVHFLQRSDEPVQQTLPFYQNSVKIVQEELAIILDYIYLYNLINQKADSPGNQELKRALINKIGNKFLDIRRFIDDDLTSMRTYAVEPTIKVLELFSRTLAESVTSFIPPFTIRDVILRNAIIGELKSNDKKGSGLSGIYKSLIDREYLDATQEDIKTEQRKTVDAQLQQLAKYFSPPGLVERAKDKIHEYIYGKEENKIPLIFSCEMFFAGSL